MQFTGILDDTAAENKSISATPSRQQRNTAAGTSRRSSLSAALDLAAQRALRSHASPHLSERHKLEQKLPLQSIAVSRKPGSVRLESNRGHLVSLTAGAAASVARSGRDDESDKFSRASGQSRSSRVSKTRRNSLVAPIISESAALHSPPSKLHFDYSEANEDLEAIAVLRSLVYPSQS